MNDSDVIYILLVGIAVAMTFCTFPIIAVSSDLGISVPRFIKDFVKEMFKDRNWFGKVCSGLLVICAVPSFIAATVIWAGKCALVYIWELGKSHGGKYYD